MSRYLSWLANGTLLVLCCFLVANTANAVIASMLAPSPDEVAPAMATAPPMDRSWSQRQTILDRNLFGATLKAKVAAAPPPSEELEATKLPLALVGTAAAGDRKLSWAAIMDQQARLHIVVQEGDDINGKARVERIEPKRVVLRENGQLRELALSDKPPPAAAKPGKRGRNNRTARAAQRRSARRAAKAPTPPPPAQNPLATAAELFSQANIVPKFDGGEMVGMEVSAIQADSAIQAAGLMDGDIITELNGIQIDSQEQGQRALQDLATNSELTGKATDANGKQKTFTVPLNAPR